jgi:XTP/dITP diphosphohydrolase
MKKNVLIATQNVGKQKEFEQALSNYFDHFHSLKSINDVDEVIEDGSSYKDNAHLKATYFYHKYQMPVIADDSGLEVIALDNYPGIYSARIGNNDTERRQLILNKLKHHTIREAWMITHITYIDDTGIYDFYHRVQGKISILPRGNNGFGYDPIFIPHGSDKTFAEMAPSDKLEQSHRGIAIKKLLAFLKEKKR